jgi:hypothetical protein
MSARIVSTVPLKEPRPSGVKDPRNITLPGASGSGNCSHALDELLAAT